jgi:phospholipid/cholesterol/gamma-HCH transport system substrate-binding protein
MLARGIRVKLAAFVVVALVGICYVGARYVGVPQWFGAGEYNVNVDLPQAGGIFTNAEVTYRGVPVGRVGGMELTADGIRVQLEITSNRPIPKDVRAVVADRSVIGEQYLDLQPQTASGPFLANGSVIPQQNTALPPAVQDVLLSVDDLTRSVPIGSLQTTISELYDATRGVGDSLRQLITSGDAFITSAADALPQTIELIRTSATVLATQNAQSDNIRSWARNLSLFGEQLRASNGDISSVLRDAASSFNEVGGFVGQLRGSLHDLLANLLTTSVVFLGQSDGVREVLAKLPVAIGIGGKVTTPQGINVGLVPTFFDPLPCTAGYGGTPVRGGLSTSGNPPLNTAARCTAPISSGIDIRGTQNAPK